MKIFRNIFSKPDKGSDGDPKSEKKASPQVNTADETRNKVYFCPMRCEGDKVYDSPGRCPVCNMHLVPVKE